MKRSSKFARESMHEVAGFLGVLRGRLGRLLPDRWLAPSPAAATLRARRLSAARMEVADDAPATSWVQWEVSRRRPVAGPAGAGSEQ